MHGEDEQKRHAAGVSGRYAKMTLLKGKENFRFTPGRKPFGHLSSFSARPLNMYGIDREDIIRFIQANIVVFILSEVFSSESEVLSSFGAKVDSKYVQTFHPHNIAHHQNAFR